MAAKKLLQHLRSSASRSYPVEYPRHQTAVSSALGRLQSTAVCPESECRENEPVPACTPEARIPHLQRNQPPLSVRPQHAQSLKSKAQAYADEEYDSLCVICMEAAPAVMFQPCLHAVACKACASKVAACSNACPMCRCEVHLAVPLPAAI